MNSWNGYEDTKLYKVRYRTLNNTRYPCANDKVTKMKFTYSDTWSWIPSFHWYWRNWALPFHTWVQGQGNQWPHSKSNKEPFVLMITLHLITSEPTKRMAEDLIIWIIWTSYSVSHLDRDKKYSHQLDGIKQDADTLIGAMWRIFTALEYLTELFYTCLHVHVLRMEGSNPHASHWLKYFPEVQSNLNKVNTWPVPMSF